MLKKLLIGLNVIISIAWLVFFTCVAGYFDKKSNIVATKKINVSTRMY